MLEYSHKISNRPNNIEEDWGFYIDLEEYNPTYPKQVNLERYYYKCNQYSRSINLYTIYEEPIKNEKNDKNYTNDNDLIILSKPSALIQGIILFMWSCLLIKLFII